MAQLQCQEAMYDKGKCMALNLKCMESNCPLEAWEDEDELAGYCNSTSPDKRGGLVHNCQST